MSEQTVAEELRLTQEKCYRLRKEVRRLRELPTEAPALRREVQRYREALSNIVFRLQEDGQVDADTLDSIVTEALRGGRINA